jgi:hypothetical protein
VRRGVREQLQIVGTVFVVGRDEQRHEVEEELLAAALVAEERVSVYDVELAFARVGKAVSFQRNRLSRIEEQQVVQPSLDLIVQSITDGISHADFSKSLEGVKLSASRALVAELLEQLEGKGAPSALVAVDRAREEEIVGAEERLDVREWDGCCLVDDYEVGMPDLVCIVGEDELYELSMPFEHIDS